MFENLAGLVLLDEDLVDGGQLDLLRLVGEGAVAVDVQPEQLLLDAHRELLQVLVVGRAQLQQLGDLVGQERDKIIIALL